MALATIEPLHSRSGTIVSLLLTSMHYKIDIMKKIFLIPALVLGFTITAQAQDVTTATNKTVEKTVVKDQKEYKEIDPVSVNNDALKTVLTKFKGHSIQEAFRAEDGDYKLVLSKDKKAKTVYIAKTGKIIKEA